MSALFHDRNRNFDTYDLTMLPKNKKDFTNIGKSFKINNMLCCIGTNDYFQFDAKELISIYKFTCTEFDKNNPWHIFIVEYLLFFDTKYRHDLLSLEHKKNFFNLTDHIFSKVSLSTSMFEAQYKNQAFTRLGFQQALFLTDLRASNILSLLTYTYYCTFHIDAFLNLLNSDVLNKTSFAIFVINCTCNLASSLKAHDDYDILLNRECLQAFPDEFIIRFTHVSRMIRNHNLNYKDLLKNFRDENQNEVHSAYKQNNLSYHVYFQKFLEEGNLLFLESVSMMLFYLDKVYFNHYTLIDSYKNKWENLDQIDTNFMWFNGGRMMYTDALNTIYKVLDRFCMEICTSSELIWEQAFAANVIKRFREECIKEIWNVNIVSKIENVCKGVSLIVNEMRK